MLPDKAPLDTTLLADRASVHQTRALIGELADAAAHTDHTALQQDLHRAWNADQQEEMLDTLDRYATDATLQNAVFDGIRDDTLNTARREAALLLATERPFSDDVFRPMLEAETTGTKELYTAVDTDYVEIRPTVPQDLPYEERFGLAMRWCTTFHHNVTVFDRESEIDVPDLSILISTEPDGERPWPYAVAERIEGDHLNTYLAAHGGDTDAALEYWELNEAGKELAMDDRVSYPPGITDRDFIMADDGLYFVDTGQYLGDYTDQQLDAADHVPDDWRDRCDPAYWR